MIVRDIDALRRELLEHLGRETVLIWDLGRVLVEFDERPPCRALAAFTRADPEVIRHVVFRSPLHDELHAGQILPDAFFEALRDQLQLTCDAPTFWRHYTDVWSPSASTVELAHELSVLVRDSFLFSNIDGAQIERLTRTHPELFELFPWPRRFLSFRLGARKPQPEAFQAVMKRMRGSPRIVFIDDREENLRAAEPFGWKTVHFTLKQPKAA